MIINGIYIYQNRLNILIIQLKLCIKRPLFIRNENGHDMKSKIIKYLERCSYGVMKGEGKGFGGRGLVPPSLVGGMGLVPPNLFFVFSFMECIWLPYDHS